MKRIRQLPPLPARPREGHKGTFGRVLVLAGSRGMSGAACLSGTAALRGGSGLVFVAVPEGVASTVTAYEPSYLTVPLLDDENGRVDLSSLAKILKQADGMDAVAVGPGLGQSSGLRLLVSELYQTLEQPLVVDADALNLLARTSGLLGTHQGPRILTPHVGEFSRLTGHSIEMISADREHHASEFAREYNVTVVLKGPGSIVTDGRQIAVNSTGNSGMATGGSGDVLTGLIGSLLGQGMSPFAAAQLGVHLHGVTGDMAAEALGERAMIASDLLAMLPAAWRSLE